ncbi:hypothetical protein [Shimia marina]|uniref:CEL-III C-terminal domain-containing protein n=1 Tax=Shimia marina TaxID=321267 RepID=A0A0P1EQT4_9RHOB|nr:hypothetical protein [Shimia marina]CUH52609.1 hypothetical protein SHM7688_02056 [Shimia marina]SFE51526.1 hypothetical protein SAMN04488037_110108 [Shimia marina]
MTFQKSCLTGLGLALTLLLSPQLATAQDPVSRNALETLPELTTAPPGPQPLPWVACAKKDSTCEPETQGLLTTRYGLNGTYTYWVTFNTTRIPCNSSVAGDPLSGLSQDNITKECAFTQENIFDAPAVDDPAWTEVAKEGGSFYHKGEGLFWMRYGAPEKYVYGLFQGSTGDNAQSDQKVTCSDSYFGIDPAQGTEKFCYVGPAYTKGIYGFKECAKEGMTCTPQENVSTTMVLRYGNETGWDTRLHRRNGGNVPCSDKFFGYDPNKDAKKRCYYDVLAPATVSSEGKWSLVARCTGTSCKELRRSISFGTSKTDTWSTQHQWGVVVTNSIEAEFGIFGTSSKVSASVAASYAQSQEFQQALNTSQTSTLTAICTFEESSDNPEENVKTGEMYQFLTGTEAVCTEGGACKSQTYTADHACIADPASDYAGPQCIPGYCANADCSECDYPDSADTDSL